MEDSFLIKQVLEGNQNAYRFLVLRYQRPLFRFLSSFHLAAQVVDEIAQDTFLSAYQNLADYDSERGASFSTWIFGIAKNRALNELAKHHRKREILTDEDAAKESIHSVDHAVSTDTVLDEFLTNTRIAKALASIPLVFRTAITLSYLKELSLEEVAHIEGCSVGTVKSRIFRGKNLLKLALAHEETP